MLRFDGVEKRFGETVAVQDLDLEIAEGEIFGLLGPNGAGKTTTVRLATGLLEPDSGVVRVAGDDPTEPTSRVRIGVAPQELALYDELTGAENMHFFGTIQGLGGGELVERARHWLDFVGLRGRRDDRVSTYSGGMKRRLNLACALVHDPPVLFLDEPTVGIDPQSRNRILESIGELAAEGRTILYTTHYMEEAERLCDRVGIIDRGRLLALDSVDGLLGEHGGAGVLEVEDESGAVDRIETSSPLAELERLQRERRLRRFELEAPTLERVFLNLTGRELRD